jgi:hypothetical protein
LLIHHDPANQVTMRLKSAQRIQIVHALQFIHRRFNKYHSVKTPHGQWEPSGHKIWDLYNSSRHSKDRFVKSVMNEIGIPLAGNSEPSSRPAR